MLCVNRDRASMPNTEMALQYRYGLWIYLTSFNLEQHNTSVCGNCVCGLVLQVLLNLETTRQERSSGRKSASQHGQASNKTNTPWPRMPRLKVWLFYCQSVSLHCLRIERDMSLHQGASDWNIHLFHFYDYRDFIIINVHMKLICAFQHSSRVWLVWVRR